MTFCKLSGEKASMAYDICSEWADVLRKCDSCSDLFSTLLLEVRDQRVCHFCRAKELSTDKLNRNLRRESELNMDK